MPTTYAHYRFGDKCINTLPNNLKEIINNNREIFNYGVHGPDIFFYYNCLKHNSINQMGSDMHEDSYRHLLEKIKPNYLSNTNDRNAKLSYLLGFTCHFTLDSYCHGYIEIKEATSKVSHNKIESQFDRYLLIQDGYNPVKKKVTFSLKPNKQMAKDISELFGDIDEKTVYKTLADQRLYLNLLKDNSKPKRFLLNTVMDLAHVDSFKDLLITENNDERCSDAVLRLNKYFDKAVNHYPILANDLIEYLNNDIELPKYFDHTFGPKEDYKNIPVLSLSEERNYKVEDFQD